MRGKKSEHEILQCFLGRSVERRGCRAVFVFHLRMLKFGGGGKTEL